MKRVHIIVTGRVQGVFFRARTRDKARELNLRGWVRNLDSDKVEVMAEGPGKEIAELIGFCNKGPDVARVDDVKVKFIDEKEELGPFSIRY
jgi:acylphosphatase